MKSNFAISNGGIFENSFINILNDSSLIPMSYAVNHNFVNFLNSGNALEIITNPLLLIGLQETSKLKSFKLYNSLNACIKASIPSHVILLLYKDISKKVNRCKFVKHPANYLAPITVKELLNY